MKTTQEIIAQKKVERERVRIEAVQADVKKARNWAKVDFNVYVDEKTTPSTIIDPPRYLVVFPDVDRMTVTPVVYGKPVAGAEAEFRLVWQGGWLYWVGNFALRRELLGADPEEIWRCVGPAKGTR